MDAFAAVLARTAGTWTATEVALTGCEAVSDFVDLARDVPGDVRLLVIEQDDEFAVIVRADGANGSGESGDDEQPRAFLSDRHAAGEYPLAAIFADELDVIGARHPGHSSLSAVGNGLGNGPGDELNDELDDELDSELDDAAGDEPGAGLGPGNPLMRDSAPCGDADVAADLGTPAAELLRLTAHEGTLPIDILAAVWEQAGCGEQFDELRA